MSTSIGIRTGFWIDEDKPWFSSILLTIPNTEANFLVAAISFLLASLVLPLLWKTLILILYISTYTRPSARTFELDQQRVLFRNARSSTNAVTALVISFWHWRRGKTGIPARETLQFSVLLALAITCVVVLGLGGIFVPSLFASDATDDVAVLAKPGSCGFLKVPDGTAEIIEVPAVASRELDETAFARRYASQFYGGQLTAERIQSGFPVLSLPYTTKVSAPCPFDSQICFPNSGSSISFDTGLLDSHEHLGINARNKDRVRYRWKSTCTPLKLSKDMYEIRNESDSKGTVLRVNFTLGPSSGHDYTFSWTFSDSENPVGYHVLTTSSYRGYSDAKNMSWTPSPPLNRTDADVSLVFITQQMVAYATKVDDLVFQANGTNRRVLETENGSLYLPDNNARIIACADQHEFCNPTNGLCSGLDGALGSGLEPFSTMSTTKQLATISRIRHDFQAYTMERSIKELGNNGLIANSIIGNSLLISPGLPDNQWQLETKRWFETGLAKLQANSNNFVNVSYSDQDSSGYKFVSAGRYTNDPDLNSELDKLCSKQRIRSNGRVQNFNVAYLIILLGLSLVAVGVSEVLAPWVVQKFFTTAYKEWEADGLLGIWKRYIDPLEHMQWVQGKYDVYVVMEDVPERVQLVGGSDK